MASKRKVAYIGTYSEADEPGLYVCDVKKNGELFTVLQELPTGNTSYLCLSKDCSYLYAVVDEGVASFRCEDDGSLTYLNTKSIGGMRGCYIVIDSESRYVFVAGFHDGRVTMVKLKSDGSLSGVADGVFHKGHAISSNDRRLDHPKVTCVCLTPDEKYLCAADYGLNQIKIYEVDYNSGKLELVDTVRCAMDSAPRRVCFSNSGKYFFVLTEVSSSVEVFKYKDTEEGPEFELLHRVPVLEETYVAAAATHMFMHPDGKHLFVSIDGMNYVSWLTLNEKTGELKIAGNAPVSGDYPKFITPIHDTDEIIVINHDANEIRDFNVNFKGGYMLQCAKPSSIRRANCICFKNVAK